MGWQDADEVYWGVVVRFGVEIPANFVVGSDNGAFAPVPSSCTRGRGDFWLQWMGVIQ